MTIAKEQQDLPWWTAQELEDVVAIEEMARAATPYHVPGTIYGFFANRGGTGFTGGFGSGSGSGTGGGGAGFGHLHCGHGTGGGSLDKCS